MLNLFCDDDKRYFCAKPNCKYHILANVEFFREPVIPNRVEMFDPTKSYKDECVKTIEIRRHRFRDGMSQTEFYFCEICRNASETLAQIKRTERETLRAINCCDGRPIIKEQK
jgi:hypothetical protein